MDKTTSKMLRNFSISSATGNYHFPDYESLSGNLSIKYIGYRGIPAETPDDHDTISQDYQIIYEGNQTEVLRNYLKNQVLPGFITLALLAGDDDYYDYLPDYAQMIQQFNEMFNIYPKDDFNKFLSDTNSSLHYIGRGWEE
jgi:hypothetical protein